MPQEVLPVLRPHPDQRVVPADAGEAPGEQVERLARIPLLYQPGTTWEYSLAYDVLGRVVEAASGKRLGDFLSERLFKPLGMKNSSWRDDYR